MGIDFTAASVELLKKRYAGGGPSGVTVTQAEFRVADLTEPGLELGERFDLINVMNVLFHIPEADRFAVAMRNLSNHLAPGGRIVTTEYMPRTTMRTNWMMVRSRYEMESAASAVGLKIVGIRACTVFGNDPMGLDGPDTGLRQQFNGVRTGMNQILGLQMNEQMKAFFVKFLAEVESSVLNFCRERVAEVDMPSQKLVVMGRE
jgi:SAM-dependent methyltransferase